MFGGATAGFLPPFGRKVEMNKKMMLLALSVVSAALFALPAVASATPAHINAPEAFTISGTETVTLEQDDGLKVECHASTSVTGSGNFENTTTGTIQLLFHGCTSSGINCNSEGQPSGTITTTVLPFHLVTLSGKGGVLITSNNGHFATFNCTIFVKKEVTGNGVLGTITSPECGKASKTAAISFAQGATGSQLHPTYTGTTYQLKSNGTNSAQIASGQIHFPVEKTLTCT